MEHLRLAATVLLIFSSIVGAVDFVYIHLWKYRLHSHTDTRYEHKLHTLQTLIGTASIFFLFCYNFGGLFLWLALTVVITGLVIEMFDVACERKSRMSFGGLSSFEYGIHVIGSGVKLAFVALMLGAKPSQAWWTSTPVVSPENYGSITHVVGWTAFLAGGFLTILHLWLLLPRYIQVE